LQTICAIILLLWVAAWVLLAPPLEMFSRFWLGLCLGWPGGTGWQCRRGGARRLRGLSGSGEAYATLDDSEAATIAYGVEKGAITLIDERKATRLCGERYPRLTVGTSLDLLGHGALLAELGDNGTADAVFNALRLAGCGYRLRPSSGL
jgi:hypothetical protein